MKKNFLSILLTLCMCLSLLPTAALANTTNQASLSYNKDGSTNTTEYATLQAALNQVESICEAGATNVVITLLTLEGGRSNHNIESDKDIYTLPTGTYTISAGTTKSKNIHFKKGNDLCKVVIPTGANVTIGTASDQKSIGMASGEITVQGSLTVDKGFIGEVQAINGTNRYTPVVVENGGKLTLNGVSSQIFGDVTVKTGGSMTLNGGGGRSEIVPKTTISGGTVTVKNGGRLYQVEITGDDAKLDLKNGTVESTIACSAGQLTVSGGEVKGAVTLSGGAATISGGTFQNGFSKEGGTAAISGGKFKKSVKTTVTDDTVGTMLAEGFGFYREGGMGDLWYDKDSTETDLSGDRTILVVKETPIQGDVTIACDSNDLVAGGTVALTANYKTADGYSNQTPTFAWKIAGESDSISNEQTLTISPTTAGAVTYTCTVTLDEYQKTGSVTLNVPDPVPTDKITPPTAVQNLTYTGKEQTLITAGSLSEDESISSNYHMEYKLGADGDWKTDASEITAKDADAYKVYYRVVKNSDGTGTYGKYECQTSVPVSIAPFVLTADNCSTDNTKAIQVTLSSPTFDGNAHTPTATIERWEPSGSDNSLVLVETVPTNMYTLSGVETDAGEHTVTITGSGNYSGSVNLPWYIEKAVVPTLTPMTHVVEQEYTIKTDRTIDLQPVLAALIADGAYPSNAGTLTYAVGSLPADTSASISGTTLKYAVTDPDAKADDIYGIPVIVRSQNYQDVTLNISVKMLAKAASGGGSSRPSLTVPVSSEKGSVTVKATVSKGNASVEISDKQINQVAAEGAENVTVDLTKLKNIESATLPAHVVETTSSAEEVGLTVALPTGTVSLDSTALCSLPTDQDVTVSVQRVPATDLNEEQQAAVGDMANIGLVFDVDILVGKEKQSEFNGGKLTISVPYTPKKGEDPSKLTVWFINDNGRIQPMGGYYDAEKKCFVFETTHLSRYVLVSVENMPVFTDVPDDAYYADAVTWAVLNGITTGMTDTTFAPDVSCTRAQIVTFLWRAAGQPEGKNVENPFSDVSESDYFYPAVLWAVENKITTGTTGTTFSPDDTCTRAQAAAFLYRNEQANGGGFADAWAFRLPFTDVPAWCYEAVAWCYLNGITQGTSETTFSPNLDCTRAQIVTMLYRLLGE